MIFLLYKGLSVADREWVTGYFLKMPSISNGEHTYSSYILPVGKRITEAVWVMPGTECLCSDISIYDNEAGRILLYQNDIIRCRDKKFIVSFGRYGAKGVNQSGHQGFYLEGYDRHTKDLINEGLRNDIYYWVCLGQPEYIDNINSIRGDRNNE